MENEGMKSNEQDYSSWVYCIFVLLIFSGVGRSISKLTSALAFGNVTIGLLTLLCEIINVGFFIAMLNKKKWGLFAFIVMMLLQIPLNYLLGCNDMGQVYLSVLVRIAILFLVLLIPNDGIPAWKTLLGEDFLRKDVNRQDVNSDEPVDIKEENTDEEDNLLNRGIDVTGATVSLTATDCFADTAAVQISKPCMEQDQQEPSFDAEKEEEYKLSSVQPRNGKKNSLIISALAALTLLCISLAIALVMKNVHRPQESSIRYLYYGQGTIHLDPRCEEGLIYYGASVFFRTMASENRAEDAFEKSSALNVENARKLYDALCETYDMGPFQDFLVDIKNIDKRKRLYDAIHDRYDVGDYDYFCEKLGFRNSASEEEEQLFGDIKHDHGYKFCSKCISTLQMDQIRDSIVFYRRMINPDSR